MREDTANNFAKADPGVDTRSNSRSAAKSSFRKILAISLCGSRCCEYAALSLPRKFLRMNTLENRQKMEGGPEAKDVPEVKPACAHSLAHLAAVFERSPRSAAGRTPLPNTPGTADRVS